MKLWALLLSPCFVLAHLPAQNPKWTFLTEPVAEWNDRFASNSGWIGGDGAYSVALKDNRIAWLFSDTWIGSIREGKRTDATIVNNTVVIQNGRDGKTPFEFIVRKDAQQKPTAFITPKDGPGWFWLFSAALVEHRLLMFLPRIEKTNDPGVFGFRQSGLTLGIVENPSEPPEHWRIEQKPVPFVSLERDRNLTWGMATLVADNHLYIFGTDENRRGTNRSRHLVLARVPLAQAIDLSAWRFFKDNEWISDHRQCARLAENVASEGSVSYLPKLKRYVFVYTDRGLSDKIMMRTANHPWGPWSNPETLLTCPEMATDKNLFSYAAKAHPEIAGDDELIISYVVNSFDFWQVARDARLYWPRFVRVRFSTAP